jgi:DNA-binding beta-propeller fold protein YncE
MTIQRVAAAALVFLLGLAGTEAAAQIAVSANDSKVVLVDGVQSVVRNAPPDTVTILDLSAAMPRVVAELPVPASIVGPPSSVAIAPDETFALVTAATKIDPADPARTVPDNRVTVIALDASPRVTATLEAGAGASGVSINRAGTLALVANRIEGTVSVFAIEKGVLRPVGKVDLGAPESGPSHVAFTRDGRMALVTRNNDSLISLLAIDGTTVTLAKRDIGGGFKPYGLEVTPAGDLAFAAHVGAGATGGVDTISVIDLRATPPRVIDQVPAGPTVEGIAIAPDGRHVAVTIMDGSNLASGSPFFRRAGRLKVFAVDGRTLRLVTEADTGRWCQGVAWARTSRSLVVQCAADRELVPFTFDGRGLTRGAPLRFNSGPSGIRTADPLK